MIPTDFTRLKLGCTHVPFLDHWWEEDEEGNFTHGFIVKAQPWGGVPPYTVGGVGMYEVPDGQQRTVKLTVRDSEGGYAECTVLLQGQFWVSELIENVP